MIRVIGRYLGKANDNTVNLFTCELNNGIKANITIKITRPTYLGSVNNIITGPPIHDGNLTEYKLDSLIINVAGETGILPQLIKGIMQKESIRFQPSYRYEIYQDAGGKVRNSFNNTHTYWIKADAEPIPKIPNHGTIWYGMNTSKLNYPEPSSIWDFLMANDNLYLYYKSDVFIIDPSRNKTSAVYDSEKKKILEIYDKYFAKYKVQGLNDNQAEDKAKKKYTSRLFGLSTK